MFLCLLFSGCAILNLFLFTLLLISLLPPRFCSLFICSLFLCSLLRHLFFTPFIFPSLFLSSFYFFTLCFFALLFLHPLFSFSDCQKGIIRYCTRGDVGRLYRQNSQNLERSNLERKDKVASSAYWANACYLPKLQVKVILLPYTGIFSSGVWSRLCILFWSIVFPAGEGGTR
jgi:hypothetical protein